MLWQAGCIRIPQTWGKSRVPWGPWVAVVRAPVQASVTAPQPGWFVRTDVQFSVLGPGGLRWGRRVQPGVLTWWWAERKPALLSSSHEDTNPHREGPPSWPRLILGTPKPPPPNTITLGEGFNRRILGDTDIPSMTWGECHRCEEELWRKTSSGPMVESLNVRFEGSGQQACDLLQTLHRYHFYLACSAKGSNIQGRMLYSFILELSLLLGFWIMTWHTVGQRLVFNTTFAVWPTELTSRAAAEETWLEGRWRNEEGDTELRTLMGVFDNQAISNILDHLLNVRI